MLSFLRHWWLSYQFKRRWWVIYRAATPITSNDDLYLSIAPLSVRPKVTSSISRTLERIPTEPKEDLLRHWKRLRVSWDHRQTGISLRLPVVGVFDGPFAMAADFGTMIGLALRARGHNGFDDSGESLMRLFAGMFLPLWDYQIEYPPEYLDVMTAKMIAKYLCCVRESASQSEFAMGWHAASDDLIREWGFDMDGYEEWSDRKLRGV